MDPALAYDTVSYEPILNVYETLVNYNGTDTTTYVPTLATCVPGTAQCVTDYGTNLTAGFDAAGVPEYYTFVIDPAAHFYDPSTNASWNVYPSDVMFSIARTLAFTDVPYAGKTAGWMLSQALLSNGSTSFDSGLHSPYNNTPGNVLSSMLINDSTYCPAKAMDGVDGNGCVTYVANGSGQYWPYFLEFVADNLGASIVPCGWFTAEGAGIPGWAGTAAPSGHGPCLLPDGGSTTNDTTWTSYIAGLSPTAWDSFEELNLAWPSTQPAVRWTMVGSGPYASAVEPDIAYELTASAGYEQPSACSGTVAGIATYSGYCDPAPGHYLNEVNVFWEPSDAAGISQYEKGQAVMAGIETAHTSMLESLAAAGELYYFEFPTPTLFFTPVDLAFNEGQYVADFPTEPAQSIAESAFSDIGLRNFYADSYPYLSIGGLLTTDGIQNTFNSGGPIPYGMGNYYPANVSFPGGDPYHATLPLDTNPTDNGSPAWWWAQLNNGSSPYYDPQVASCTSSAPCTWAIPSLAGDPTDDNAIADWISSIESLTGNALQPFSFNLTFTQFLTDLNCGLSGPGCPNPVVSFEGLSAFYSDPTQYVAALVQASSPIASFDSFPQQVSLPAYNSSGLCGHGAVNYSDLLYWAHASEPGNVRSATLDSSCQGVAYGVAAGHMRIAAGMAPDSPAQVLDYNLIEQITNRLAMYLWNGQANFIVSAAPWISESSINQNKLIGAAGDQVWFHIQYAVPVYKTNLTFKETGLPWEATWTASVGSPPVQVSNTSWGSGTATLLEPNGTVSFTIIPPTGYGVAQVTGPKGTTFSSTTMSGSSKGTTLTVKFGALETVWFEQYGLPGPSNWSVTLTPTAATGAPGGTGNGTEPVWWVSSANGSINFTLPAGAHYKYQITKPIDYRASGGKGSFGVPTGTFVKLVKFAPNTANLVFVEHGFKPSCKTQTYWYFYLNETSPPLGSFPPLGSCTNTFTLALFNGTYSWSAPGFTPSSGTFTVTWPHGLRISFTWEATHSSPSGGISREASALSGHADLIATTLGREAT